jgi:hyperosmotically inducible periplasmic protein
MKRLAVMGLGCLLIAIAGCDQVARTSVNSPNTPNETGPQPNEAVQQASQNDASSQIRKRQLNADIRAREQRASVGITGGDRQEGDLESEVRSKLEANIPAGQLAIDAEPGGVVTVSGTVPTQQQLDKIEPLAREIYGVNDVTVNVAIANPEAQ